MHRKALVILLVGPVLALTAARLAGAAPETTQVPTILRPATVTLAVNTGEAEAVTGCFGLQACGNKWATTAGTLRTATGNTLSIAAGSCDGWTSYFTWSDPAGAACGQAGLATSGAVVHAVGAEADRTISLYGYGGSCTDALTAGHIVATGTYPSTLATVNLNLMTTSPDGPVRLVGTFDASLAVAEICGNGIDDDCDGDLDCADSECEALACDDGNACTMVDVCTAGVCVGGSTKACPASSVCALEGVCDPMTGKCSTLLKADDEPCEDGDLCTPGDTCQAGECLPGTPIKCKRLDGCHVEGVCNSETGECSNPVVNSGAVCDDGNPCTTTDTCTNGICSGTTFACPAPAACHTVGSCDPEDGTCSAPIASDDSTCDDGNACTVDDSCTSGACAGTAVTCPAPTECHTAGACVPATGACTEPAVADGTACSKGICAAGVCKAKEEAKGCGCAGFDVSTALVAFGLVGGAWRRRGARGR